MDEKIQEWYITEYPDDELRIEIDDKLTFEEAYHALKMGYDFYEEVGVGDSVVRERIFSKLASIYHIPYDDIYKMWIEAV